MLSIRSSADMARALRSALDADLRSLLRLRMHTSPQNRAFEAHFVIVEPRDSAAAITEALGFDPAASFVEKARLGDPDFMPGWEWLERHPGWIEIVFILTDDGFAHVLLLPDRDDIDATLLRLVREHA